MKRVLFIVLVKFLCGNLMAQNYTCPCVEDDCGDVISDFYIDGEEAVVCDGYEFEVVNNTGFTNIDQYIWFWGDGTFNVYDTPENTSHIYSIPDSLVCNNDDTTYEICLLIVRECGEGVSCHSTNKPVKVIHRPKASFSFDNQVCVNQSFLLTNNSCNAETYLWDFGDNNTSNDPNPSHIYDTPGTYSIILTVSNECHSDSYSQDIEVLGFPEADFYFSPQTSLCNQDTLFLVDRSNQWGSTSWSFMPNDTNLWCFADTLMNFNSDSIALILKAHGFYDINLTSENICGEDIATINIEVFESPYYTLSDLDQTFCDEVIITQADVDFTYGGEIDTINWTFINGIPAQATGPVFSTTFSEPGLIIMDLASPCGDLRDTIEVNVANTDPIQLNSPPSVLCQDEDPINLMDYVEPDNGDWFGPGISNDSIFDPAVLNAGTYSLNYSLSQNEDCPNTETIEITILDSLFVDLETVLPACDELVLTPNVSYNGDIIGYNWTFLGGTPSSSNLSNPQNIVFTNSGMVIIEITGTSCNPKTDTIFIDILSTDTVAISPENPDTLCQNDEPILLLATPSGGQWIGSSGAASAITPDGVFDPSGLLPGVYTLTYSTGGPGQDCEDAQSFSIEILESISVDIVGDYSACESIDFTPNVTYTGVIDSFFWNFGGGQPNTATTAFPVDVQFDAASNPYLVTIEVSGYCGAQMDNVSVFVQESEQILIEEVIPMPLCSGGGLVDLEANLLGGIWYGTGIIDQVEGIFDPTSVIPNDFYTIVYKREQGECIDSAMIVLEVVQSETVTFEGTILCENSPPFDLEASDSPGVWLGTGIVDSIEGIFDPTIVPPNQEYLIEYHYTDSNLCEVVAIDTILVEAFPVQNYLSELTLCLSDVTVNLVDLLQYSTEPEGGETVWSGPGIIDSSGLFNSTQQGLFENTYTIYMQYARNECQILDSALITLIEATPLQLSPQDTVCIQDSTYQLMANLVGGAWQGPGVNSITGLINLAQAGGGTWIYVYSYQLGTSCMQEDSVIIQVDDPAGEVFAGLDIEICQGPETYQLEGGLPAGAGFWTGPGLIDSLAGIIDLTILELGTTYTYSYCFESDLVASCSACASRSFTILPRPIAAFSLEGLPCIGEQLCMDNQTVNGVSYFWDFGNGETSSDFEPCTDYDTPGTYFITLVATAANSCKDTLVSESIYVSSPPIADFMLLEAEGCAPFEVQVINNSFGDDITQVWYIAGDTIMGPNLENFFIDSITTDSIFTITLEVSNQCATITQVRQVLVHPYPVIEFGISFDEGCSPLEVDFINTTLGNPDTCFWYMGNDSFYIDVNPITENIPPNQIYYTSDTTITTYPITLVATNMCGTRTLTKEVTVTPPEVEAFIEQDTFIGCQPFTIHLESISTPGSVVTWKIIDEDGNQLGSNEEDPVITLDSSGIHTIILFAASNCDVDSDTAYIEVLPAPEVSFEHLSFVCQGSEISFTNTSVAVGGSFWDFGDGMTSNESSPTHIYTEPDSYIVTLIANSLVNDCPATYQSQVIVPAIPIAGFNASETNGCGPLTILFTNTSTGASGYDWDFGDGSSNSSDPNPTHTFYEPGIFTVTLTVFDDFNCFSDSSIINILVYDHPQSSFSFEMHDYCLGYDTICMINTSVGATAYEWNFQDMNSNLESPCFYPNQDALSVIQLTVKNIYGCEDDTTLQVEILPSPLASFIPTDTMGCEDLKVVFQNTSVNGDNFSWYYGDGNSSTDFSPIYTYHDSGDYVTRLIVTNNNGCPADTASIDIKVWEKPIADFSFAKTDECGTPSEVVFYNNSIGNVDNYWDFGNGMFSDQTIPVHVYQDTGLYQIRLIIENEFGCLDTMGRSIEIFGQPIAGFSHSPLAGCEDFEVTFINMSEEARSFIWEVESLGAFDDVNGLQVIFNTPGEYGMRLIAIYNEYCQDTLSLIIPIKIYESPISDFDFESDPDENIIGDVQFFNLSESADEIFWDFGDGHYSSENNPFHEYNINRNIQVLLTSYNYNDGVFTCIDTISKPVAPEWITTFFAPNAFAPEYGMERIREFKPVGIGLKNYNISIYAPTGNLVWFSNKLEDGHPQEAWNGVFHGKIVPQGAYVWVAQVTFVDGNAKTFSGTVTVLR